MEEGDSIALVLFSGKHFCDLYEKYCKNICIYTRAQTNSIFDIRIFFNFQTNSPNVLLHIKVVK